MAKPVKFTFDPFKLTGVSKEGLSKKKQREALREIADMILDRTSQFMLAGNSPVAGEGKYQKLSKKYANAMKGGNRVSDLFLEGDLQESMVVTGITKGKLTHTVVGELQQKKADNHNRGVTLPRRPFIPEGKDAKYKREIITEMKDIILSKKGE